MEPIWTSRKRSMFFGLPFSFTKYTLTEEKVLIDTGFFNQREEEVRLYRILDLSLTRTFMQRIMGLGTVTCKTSDKALPILELKNIKNSKFIKEQLSDLVEQERIKKRVSSRETMGQDDDDHCCHDHDDHDVIDDDNDEI